MNSKVKPLEVILDRSEFPNFAKLTQDPNPIHTDYELAIKKGFKDTPAQGVMIQALFERFALENEFMPSVFQIRFREPAYPEKGIIIEGNYQNENLTAECISDGRVIAKCEMKKSKKAFERINGQLIGEFNYLIKEDSRDEFSRILQIPDTERVPIALASSSIPASILKLHQQVNRTNEGLYTGAEISVLNTPNLGEIKVEVYETNKPRKIRNNGYMYTLHSVCYQNGSPIIKGVSTVITKI